MTLYNFFKAKQKLRRKDAQRSSTSDLDTSVGILAPPFPPLLSRAKSPSDILDFVGYPRLQVRTHSSPLLVRKVAATSTNAPLTIRNKTPLNINTATTAEQVAQSSAPVTVVQTTTITTTAPPPLTSASSPRVTSAFHMPIPKKAMAPTWRILNADQAEKTLIAEDPEKCVKSSGDIHHVNLLQQQVMDFERERQAWARREEEHRHLEQQMLQKIQDNQAKIDQLSSLPQTRQSISNHHSHRTSFDSFASHQQSTPSYVADNDNDDGTNDNGDAYDYETEDDDDDPDDDGDCSTFDNNYNSYPIHDPCQPNNAYLDRYHRHNHMGICSYPIDNDLLLGAPMNQNQYQRIQQCARDNDLASDDDLSDDSYQHNNTYTRQYSPYFEGSDYDDDVDDEASLEDDDDDVYLNLVPWQRFPPKAVYGDYWHHPPPPRRRRSSNQQHNQREYMMHYPPIAPPSAYYQQQQRPTSAHVLQEHQRQPLRRHHSFGGDPNQAYYQHQAYKNRRSSRI